MYDFIVAPDKMPLSWEGGRRGYSVWELVRLYQKHMDSERSQESLDEFRATLLKMAEEEASARPFEVTPQAQPTIASRPVSPDTCVCPICVAKRNQ